MMKKFIGLTALILCSLTNICLADDEFVRDGWTYYSLGDPFTDIERYLVYKGKLVVKCDAPGASSLYVTVIGDKYIGTNYKAYDAKYRIDKNPVITATIHAKGKSANLINDVSTSQKIINEIAIGSMFNFTSRTYGAGSSVARVDLTGAASAIKWVNQKCQAEMLP